MCAGWTFTDEELAEMRRRDAIENFVVSRRAVQDVTDPTPRQVLNIPTPDDMVDKLETAIEEMFGPAVGRSLPDPSSLSLTERISDLERQVKVADALARATMWALAYVVERVGITESEIIGRRNAGNQNLRKAHDAIHEYEALGGRY